MDRVLEGLEPKRVFYYFEELTKIPHGSGDTKRISDYCVEFAKSHGLTWYQDELNNVIIIKPASAGYEDAPAVMLQGHLDMVNEKGDTSNHDFATEPLELMVEDGWIHANDTTLGGDDGIAIAYALALLEGEYAHPRLECVFTIDEEVGMEGATGIDLSMCKAKYLINLDSEEEGYLLAGCAGGVRYDLELPVRFLKGEGRLVTISITGLNGGHSGAEINKGRANANILMGRMLYLLSKRIEFALVSMEGGSKDNAITRSAKVTMVVKEEAIEEMQLVLEGFLTDLKGEYRVSDRNIEIRSEAGERVSCPVVFPIDQEKILFLLMQAPYGVQAESLDIPGLVETSLNLGVLKLSKEGLHVRFSVRSSVSSRKKALTDKLEYLVEFLGGEYTSSGDYPAWEYNPVSKLRDLMTDTYQKIFGKKMEVQAIHAGLECGIISSKLPGIDIVSIGPDMQDIHTPKERLSVASTERMWRYLLEVLKSIDGHML